MKNHSVPEQLPKMVNNLKKVWQTIWGGVGNNQRSEAKIMEAIRSMR